MELGHWDTGDQQQEVVTEEGLWAELYHPSQEENASPKTALYLPFFSFFVSFLILYCVFCCCITNHPKMWWLKNNALTSFCHLCRWGIQEQWQLGV